MTDRVISCSCQTADCDANVQMGRWKEEKTGPSKLCGICICHFESGESVVPGDYVESSEPDDSGESGEYGESGG